MYTKRIRAIVLFLSCMILLGSSIVYARDAIFVDNNIDTGVIDIELDEYQKTPEGALEPWIDGIVIWPGDTISKIPRITNVGYDCYVRAKLDFSLDDLENMYFGMDEHWVFAEDGYWYYTEILKHEEYIDIFQGIQIPDDFDQEYEGEKVALQIDVDAIQINNFLPDYEKEKPWGDVQIQNCIQKYPYTIQSLIPDNPKNFEIQYDGKTKKLVKNEDDFFLNIPVLFPGDVYTDTLHLENDSSDPIRLFFSAYSENSNLLDNILLRIVLDNGNVEKLIYEGPLASKNLEEWMLLAEISEGGEQELIYTIEVPKELDNPYTLLEDSVRWMFSVENIENSVKTGDYANVYIPIVLMIASGAVIVGVVLTRKSSLS